VRALLERAAAIADDCAALAASGDVEGAFPSAEFQMIAEAGLLAAPLAREVNGPGLDGSRGRLLALLALLKQLGRGNLSVGRIYEGHVNALQLIQTFGTAAQVERWAADARDRRMLFAVWNTEATEGVTLRPLGDGTYRMHGAKTFASGAGHVQRPIVPGALPDGGWQMTIVPLDRVAATIDKRWWQPLGMRASASFKVDFSGVVLEPDDLLGTPGDYHRQPWFSGGAIRFAAVQLGGAEALFDATRAYLRELDRTSDPYQRARVAEMAVAVESGSLWLRGAARAIDLGPDAATVDVDGSLAYAYMTRLAIERICQTVLELAERCVGARGLLRPQPTERIVRDLTIYLRQPAPDAAVNHVGQHVLERAAPVHALWPASDV
jgi:alkylation response protein AidB-like acyl-CoA dehydrogenase